MCVCLGGEESEIIWNKCENGKGKEEERHLSASVMNSPSPFVQGSPTMAHTYKICMVYDHAYRCFLYKGILHLTTKKFKLNTDCTKVVGVEYYIYF